VSHPAALPSWHKGEELQASTQIIVQCTVKMVKIETLPPFDAITSIRSGGCSLLRR
jgi:hypothetical protein